MAEIADGRLALRGRIDHQVAETARQRGQAAGRTGEALDAEVEAARIRAGLDALATDSHLSGDDGVPRNPDGGYDTQLAWLAQLSTAYGRQRTTPASSGVPSTPAHTG